MSILVTGGGGYIGSHMVHQLVDVGRAVTVLDDLSAGRRDLLPAGIDFVEGDAGDMELTGELIRNRGIRSVIHFAGAIVVPESVIDPLKYYRTNTMKSRNLIEACVRGGVKHFIFSSTAAVYGNPATTPVPEDAALAPVSPYGTSKLMTELMLRDTAAAHRLGYAILRYFNVAGADPAGRTGQCSKVATHLIKVAVESATGKRAGMSIFGTDYATADGTAVRDYIHVCDLAAAHALALRHLEAGGRNLTANCGYGRGYSVKQVIEAVKRISGCDFPVALAARRVGDPASLVSKSDLLRSELGWVPAHQDLDTIVRHALAWERRLGSSVPPASSTTGFGASNQAWAT